MFSSTTSIRSLALCVAAGAAALTACGSGAADPAEDGATPVADDSVGLTAPADDRRSADSVIDGTFVLPDGAWELVGYGTVLVADGEEVVAHHLTSSTCTIGDDFDNEFDVDHASDDGAIITLDLVGPTTDHRLRPLVAAPVCDSGPEDMLDAVDEVFRKHYPFFDERAIDWPTEVETIASTGTDPASLQAGLAEFMVRLGDGHTTFDDLDLQPDLTGFGVDGVDDIEAVEALMNEALDAALAGLADAQVDATGSVAWGTLDSGTGYLLLTQFFGLTADGNARTERDALVAALDQAIADLADVESLVIDLRFNEGGDEDLAVSAAGYFVDAPTEAYRKWPYAEPDPLVQTIVVEPQSVFFDGPVILLTSPVTASAAEVFGLAMRSIAETTIVGRPSYGEFSDAIDWVLPDGTEFTMSMEVYTDLDGLGYESVGLPVDVLVPFDEALDAATLCPEHLPTE